MSNTGLLSDGYHTFDEMYEHRHALFLALMCTHPSLSYISRVHHDGTEYDGWFLAGMMLPTGQVTYHLPGRLWDAAVSTEAKVMDRAHEWDGHTPDDAVRRLLEFVRIMEGRA